LINLSEGFVVFSEQVFVTFSLIITDGVVGIGEFCKVEDIFTGQRGKVGVVKVLSHGGVIVCCCLGYHLECVLYYLRFHCLGNPLVYIGLSHPHGEF
jgi:hypothetical protein